MKRVNVLFIILGVVLLNTKTFAAVDIPVTNLAGPYPSGGIATVTQCKVHLVTVDDASPYYQYAPSSNDVLIFYGEVVSSTAEIDSVPSPLGRYGDKKLSLASGKWHAFYMEDAAGYVNSTTANVNIHASSGVKIGVLRPGVLVQAWNKSITTNPAVTIPQVAPQGPHSSSSNIGWSDLYLKDFTGASDQTMHLTGREILLASPISSAASVNFTINTIPDQYNRTQDISFSAEGNDCSNLFAFWMGHWAGFATSPSAEIEIDSSSSLKMTSIRIPPKGGLATRLPVGY